MALSIEQLDKELSALTKGPKEDLDPDDIIKAATPEDSPLHGEFTWDDTIAGYKWRKEEARQLIKRVTVTQIFREVEIKTVKYIRNPEAPTRVSSYRPVSVIQKNEEMARESLAREMEAIQDRLTSRGIPLSVALGLADDMMRLEQQVALLLKRLIGETREGGETAAPPRAPRGKRGR